jgi:23S rRNA (cytidine1920-2'-O)/16S rRNA (cytidine1409-2'-O)-methyltransferase
LKVLLPVVKRWLPSANNTQGSGEGTVLALIKPQFEAGRAQVSRGKGVIRDPAVHRQVLVDVLEFSRLQGFVVRGLIRSPLLGPKGNIEFLTWLECTGEQTISLEAWIDSVVSGVS